MTHGEPPRADATCDGGDLDCGSGLLLIIRSAMEPLPGGGVLLVKSREGSVREDLPAWCRLVGHGLLDARAADGGYWHFSIRKKGEDAALAADLQQARDHVWQTRVRWRGGLSSQATSRNHAQAIGQPQSFDTADAAPAAVEVLLAAIGGALSNGFAFRLSQRSIAVQQLEVVVRGRLRDPLVFLGLADGEPGLRRLELVVYVAADADEERLQALLDQTVQRCPGLGSLR
ncbi:MAG: sulfurtransferase TusA family protein, partial [Planctomycetota bacterium]